MVELREDPLSGGGGGKKEVEFSAGADVIRDLPNIADNYSPQYTHMKTYTAGEDSSRLAQAARELGLQKIREPRRQVRNARPIKTRHNLTSPAAVLDLLLETNTEDARMKSIYSSHGNNFDYFFFDDFDDDDDEEAEAAAVKDPHAEGMGGDLLSAVLGIIKGMVGPAILYLPHGFANAGYAVALPMLVVCTSLFLYSSSCLLTSWKIEQDKWENSEENTSLLVTNDYGQPRRRRRRLVLSYPELAYRALGDRGEQLVKTGIALMQSGVCLTYLIFVPQNLHTSLKILSHDYLSFVTPSYWLIVMIMLQIPLSWIGDIRRLTPTNLLANILILYGLITCLALAMYEATTPLESETKSFDTNRYSHTESTVGHDGRLENLWQHIHHLKPFASDWIMFIGTSVLLFEGSITLLVPLQEAVVDPAQREKFPRVYTKVILGIICFYTLFGITCWMAFGDNVNVVLTTSLPSGILATTVQLAYSIAVIFTFPLQNFPALEITTRAIIKMIKGGSQQNSTLTGEAGMCSKLCSLLTSRNFISSILVALLAIVAVATMDSLDKVVSLMGSLLGCPIAFIFPPLIHIQLSKNHKGIGTTSLILNCAVICMGAIAMILVSAITIAT